MKLRKNKKAQVYPVFVAIFTVIALSYALIHLSQDKKITGLDGKELLIGEKQTAVFSSIQDADAVNLFLDQASELAAQNAIFKIRNSCFVEMSTENVVDEWVSPCGKYVYPLWSNTSYLCLPDCETAFLNAFKSDFLERTRNYFKLTYVELPISYNLSIDKKEDYFLVHGISNADSGVNVLSMDERTKNLASISKAYTGGRFIWPVDYSPEQITSCFGWRLLNGKDDEHPAIDITAPKGTPVLAAAPGKIADIDRCWGRIVINHGSGISTEYLHLDTIIVSVNDEVSQGQKIGTVGGKGGKTACGADEYPAHLHFGVKYKGVASNLEYQKQKIVLKSFGTQDYIQPECLLDKGYSHSPSGSGCDKPVNTDLEKVCALYNLPDFMKTQNIPQKGDNTADNKITGNIPAPLPPGLGPKDSLSLLSEDKTAMTSANAFGTYVFRPGFTTKVKKKMIDPIKPITEWFRETWNSCTDNPKTCINDKIKEFNDKQLDYELFFADKCEEDYPLFYDLMEFTEDCFSDNVYKCSCEFSLKDADLFSRQDMQIVFDTEDNTATLFVKNGKGEYEEKAKYNFYFGNMVKSPGTNFRYYVLMLNFDKEGKLEKARLVQWNADKDILSALTFNDYTTIRIVKPEKPDQGVFINTEMLKCEYKKDKFRLCAKPRDDTKTELLELKFALRLKDKPPEPVKEGDVKIIETEIGPARDMDQVMSAAGFLAGIFPPLGYLFSMSTILTALEDYKPRNLEIITDVPVGKDGKPLDVAGYEVYCNDYLTSLLPKDVLEKYNPSHFVVMGSNALNEKVSQLDKYVNPNTYSNFLDLKDCNVPVSKANGETVLVPGIKGVMRDGKLVFNLNKCGDASILMDKILRKNYCVSLVPVDKNGNKMTDYAISNCAQTNSLLDLVVDEMIKKQLGNFIPADLIPKDLQPYIKLPDTTDLVDAAMGKRDFNFIDLVNSDKLDANIKSLAESFIVDTINKDLVGTSFVNSVNDLKVWEKQTVLNTLSRQIKNEDANTLFNIFVSGDDVSSSAQHLAVSKGIDYIDKSKAPGILKEVAKSQDPKSLAYNELISAAEREMSSDQKKQDLLDIARSGNGRAVQDKIIAKAVEKGCSEYYGITVDQAVACLRDDEINDIYHDVLNDYSTTDKARQALLDKAVDKMGDKVLGVLRDVATKRDFQGVAYDMLEKELDKLPDADKKRFISDVLEGRMPDAGTLQSEAMRMIPGINTAYITNLLQDNNVKSLIESSLKNYLQSQISSFISGECSAAKTTGTPNI